MKNEVIKELNRIKIELMQEKNLVHKLYMCTAHGSEQMTPEENEQLAEMIMRRKSPVDLEEYMHG